MSFVKDYINKCWYGAEVFPTPWRTINWDKQQIHESVKNLKPSNPDISHLRILLHGAVGAGKSSFINSLNSVFEKRVVAKVQAAPSASTSCTKSYKGHEIKVPSATLKITVFDFMGVEEKAQNVHPDDLTNALHGHLPDNYKFNSATPLSPNDPGYISTPSNREKTHCVVCVVSANTISQMPQATIDKMKAYLDEARELGIPQAVIMTMGDEICPAVKYTVKTIYMSKKIKSKMKECSDKLQVPMTCIFAVKNYNEETETNNDVDVLLLYALRQIAYLANDYVEDLGQKDHKE